MTHPESPVLRADLELTAKEWDALEIAIYGKVGNTRSASEWARLEITVLAIVQARIDSALRAVAALVAQQQAERDAPYMRHKTGCHANDPMENCGHGLFVRRSAQSKSLDCTCGLDALRAAAPETRILESSSPRERRVE